MKQLATYFFLGLLCMACNKSSAPDCFKRNGSETTEIRQVGNFTEIVFNDNMDLTFTHGQECKVEITCGENLFEKISTELSGQTLTIENKNRCNFVRGYKKRIKLNIILPYLRFVEHNGVGTLTVLPGFAQDSLWLKTESSGDIYVNGTYTVLKFNTNGNGDIYLTGSCKTLFAYMNGVNYVKAQDLSVSDYALVQTNSLGDGYFSFYGTKQVDYVLQNSGNIYYSGNPQNISDKGDGKAKGKLVKLD